MKNYPSNLLCEISGRESDIAYTQLSDDQLKGLDYALSTLSPRTADFLSRRFKDGLTYKEIGDKEGVTQERVRQIVQKGLRLLRNPTRWKYIANGYAFATGEIERTERERIDAIVRQLESEYTDKIETLKNAINEVSALLLNINGCVRAIERIAVHDAYPTLEDCNFSIRTYNILKRAGVNNLRDVCEHTRDELCALRNLGRKSFDEIVKKLTEYGLNLKETNNDTL